MVERHEEVTTNGFGTFEQLLTRDVRLNLYRFALYLTRNHVSADDLLQDTFCRALKYFGQFKQGTHFREWLFAIMNNVWKGSLKQKHHREELFACHYYINPGETSNDDPLGLASRRQILDAVNRWAKVENRERVDALFMSAVDGLGGAQIAVTQRVAVGTVMSRVHRARMSLREYLGDGYGL